VYEVEGFINQQQSTISLAVVVEVNRILNVSVPDPFFSRPQEKEKKRSGYARLLAAVVAVNRILTVSVPDPFFPTPSKRKKAVWLRETSGNMHRTTDVFIKFLYTHWSMEGKENKG